MDKLLIIFLVLFQVKHFLADYILQGDYMTGKFKDKGWVLPLLAHVAVHAAFTLAIGLCCWWMPVWQVCLLALGDATIHFTMDRFKASSKWLGRWKPLNGIQYFAMKEALAGNGLFPPVEAKARLRSNKLFWHALGLDQMVHHLTHYAVIYFLLS